MAIEKLGIVTLNDVRAFFTESNAAMIGSKDLIQDTFVYPPGKEDKITEILDKLSSPTNLLVWGTRGVGKTLFMKKTYYDLLDQKNTTVMPIYIDLNKVYHLAESLYKASTLNDADRLPLVNQLLERYYRIMIYRGVLECLRNRNLDNKVFDFLKSLLGSEFTKKNKITEIKTFLETEIFKLGSPFSTQELTRGKLNLSRSITGQEDVQKYLTNSYTEIFEKIYQTLDVRTFILIFDEFSMLPAHLQDAMMSNVIQSLETKKEYAIYFKILIMNGRYLIDTQTKDMTQHGFLPIRLEREYYDLFKGANPETSIDSYYKAVCLNRLRGMAGNFLVNENDVMQEGTQVEKLFTDADGANSFHMLVNFAGYNFRRFFNFISNICNNMSNAHYFTEEMILQQSNSHYTELLGKIKQNPDLQQYSQAVDTFLSELVNGLPENCLYFSLSDDQPFIIRMLEYFSIITQVTDKVVNRRTIPIYVLDLSTYVAIKEIALRELKEKVTKGELQVFYIGELDKVPVFNIDDFEGIHIASKIDEKFRELAYNLQEIVVFEADLANGKEDAVYVKRCIDRILNKIELKYKEKYTRETLEQKLKSYDTRTEVVLSVDSTLITDKKAEDALWQVEEEAIEAAAAGYDPEIESKELSKLAKMDSRTLEELIKLHITHDFIVKLKGDEERQIALLIKTPMGLRGTLKKVLDHL